MKMMSPAVRCSNVYAWPSMSISFINIIILVGWLRSKIENINKENWHRIVRYTRKHFKQN